MKGSAIRRQLLSDFAKALVRRTPIIGGLVTRVERWSQALEGIRVLQARVGQIACSLANLENQLANPWAFEGESCSGQRGSAVEERASPPHDRRAPDGCLTSRLCRQEDFSKPYHVSWCRRLKEPLRWHRKPWEFTFIAEALRQRGMLSHPRRGLGFGAGAEPLPAAFAAFGCTIVATDMEPERAEVHGWRTTGQYAGNPVALNARGLCDSALMARNVTFRCVDMTAVPDDLADYDFCWSSCALEHLGSLEAGVAFIRRSLECLRPGGLAVHTTEFNLSSNEDTLTTGPSVIYRRGDIQRLSAQLAEEGHQLAAVDFDAGRRILDRYVDLPPYWPAGSPVREFEPHLRLRIGPYDCTSIGLIVRKAGGEAVEASS